MITDKVTYVKSLMGADSASATDDEIEVYLELAESKVRQRCYPFAHDERDIPSMYDHLHCELASRLLMRRGAEGEIIHDENGINRHYKNVDDSDILNQIMPMVGGLGF